MKTILQINTVVNSGSTGRIAEDIGEKIIKNGWKSYIAYGRNDRPSNSELIKIGTQVDVYKHVIKSRLLDRHGFGSVNSTINFIEKIEKIKPDIIHLHNIHGYYINIDILFNFIKKSNIPVVWTLHDCWPFTGHCPWFELVDCYKWKTQCYLCPQKNEYPQRLFIDNSYRNYLDKKRIFNLVDNLIIVPVSMWLGNLVKESFLNKFPIQIINNGISLSDFSFQNNRNIIKEKLDIASRFLILGVASVWDKRKGLEDFIELSKRISQNYCIVLIGLDSKQIKKLPSNIIGIERTENVKQLAEIYSAADLFLNLTYEDNFPTTNLESLACGTPVLTYNTGGSIEAVDDETGFIVEKGDLNAVIDAIKLVEEKGKVYYSSACRERAISLYNKEDRFNEYIQLYNEILNKK